MIRKLSIVLGVIFLLVAGAGVYFWNEVRVARADTGELVGKARETYGQEVAATAMAPQRIDMLVAIEDPAFRKHRGVDLETPGAGMTTISQGLVKLIYFPEGFKPGLAKIRQSLIARYAFDPQVSKAEQIDLYLNMTYFGSVDGKPVHGIANAAQAHFGKSWRDLSDDEFIALIGMTIAPNALKPGTQASDERVARIKRYLAGEIRPASVMDFNYTGRQSGSFGQEAYMSVLRWLTGDAFAEG